MNLWLCKEALALIALIVWISGTRTAMAQVDDRSRLIDSYIEHGQTSSVLFQPPPPTHLVPNFNTLTYALAFERKNAVIYPGDEDGNRDQSASDSLRHTGYTIAPHLAMSLKKVGLGFSIENSKQEAHWQLERPNYYAQQKSTVSSSGLGLNLSFLPFEKWRKDNKLALIIGGKSLSAKHTMSDFSASSELKSSTYRYSVLKLEAGANLTVKLLEHFSVIPWADYAHTELGDAESVMKDSENQYLTKQYADDLRLFWNQQAKFRYGVDLAIRVVNFEIRIGGLFGTLAKLNTSPDTIQDNSLSLSISIDQKGS